MERKTSIFICIYIYIFIGEIEKKSQGRPLGKSVYKNWNLNGKKKKKRSLLPHSYLSLSLKSPSNIFCVCFCPLRSVCCIHTLINQISETQSDIRTGLRQFMHCGR